MVLNKSSLWIKKPLKLNQYWRYNIFYFFCQYSIINKKCRTWQKLKLKEVISGYGAIKIRIEKFDIFVQWGQKRLDIKFHLNFRIARKNHRNHRNKQKWTEIKSNKSSVSNLNSLFTGFNSKISSQKQEFLK